MTSLHLTVTPHKNGFVASNDEIQLAAIGSTAIEAVENARSTALAFFDGRVPPLSIVVSLNEPGRSTITIQRFKRPFRV
jgi:hypothetical protein